MAIIPHRPKYQMTGHLCRYVSAPSIVASNSLRHPFLKVKPCRSLPYLKEIGANKYPYGTQEGDTRKKGRPKTRWSDDIRLILGPYWTRVAEDRSQWRELEEAYARRHAELRDII
ncbi:hypothetical protein ACJJTC_018140 [Scirpophaga incertulas]